MPRSLSNWKFRDVKSFLLSHGFSLDHTRGSHHYFKKYHGGRMYMTHVQHHSSKSIPEGTMAAIVRQSGISKKEWTS